MLGGGGVVEPLNLSFSRGLTGSQKLAPHVENKRQLQCRPGLSTAAGRVSCPSGAPSHLGHLDLELEGQAEVPFLRRELWTPGARTCVQHQRPGQLSPVGPNSGLFPSDMLPQCMECPPPHKSGILYLSPFSLNVEPGVQGKRSHSSPFV